MNFLKPLAEKKTDCRNILPGNPRNVTHHFSSPSQLSFKAQRKANRQNNKLHRNSFAERMASQTQGIQQLLGAEKRAAEKVKRKAF